jgi:hypothetical protein
MDQTSRFENGRDFRRDLAVEEKQNSKNILNFIMLWEQGETSCASPFGGLRAVALIHPRCLPWGEAKASNPSTEVFPEGAARAAEGAK